jgi:hypothetical protein
LEALLVQELGGLVEEESLARQELHEELAEELGSVVVQEGDHDG